jgi:hypothetical protein
MKKSKGSPVKDSCIGLQFIRFKATLPCIRLLHKLLICLGSLKASSAGQPGRSTISNAKLACCSDAPVTTATTPLLLLLPPLLLLLLLLAL